MDKLLADLVSDVHKAWAPMFVPDCFATQEANQDDGMAHNRDSMSHSRRLHGHYGPPTWVEPGQSPVSASATVGLCEQHALLFSNMRRTR